MSWLAALLLVVAGEATAPWEAGAGSRLNFTATYDQSPFDGRFKDFAVRFWFDPREPAGARLEVTVDVTSVETRNSDRDEALAEAEWFDFANHPEARYTASGVSEGRERAYRTTGDLTLKGITRQVPVEFDWIADSRGARVVGRVVMRGDTEIDRMRFDVGTGEWADPELIGHMVEVRFDLRLERAPKEER